jgi:hypothetical protein
MAVEFLHSTRNLIDASADFEEHPIRVQLGTGLRGLAAQAVDSSPAELEAPFPSRLIAEGHTAPR